MEKQHAGTVPAKRIEAYFQPQAWIRDCATDIDGGRSIDVTDEVLSLQLDQIHTLRDYRDSTDALVDPIKLGHDGPYTVSVVSSVEEFFGVQSLDGITQEQLDGARAASRVAALQDRVPTALLKSKVVRGWDGMKGLTLHDGYRFLVASQAASCRAIAVVDGLFNRDIYKALIAETQDARIAADKVLVYCEVGSYAGPGIEIVKFDDFPAVAMLGRYQKPRGGEDYVILIAPAEPRSYLAHDSEEDDGETSTTPPRTLDITEAVRFVSLSEASAAQEEVVKLYPGSEFLIDIAPRTEPEDAVAAVAQGVPDPEGLNDERASWARQALDVFKRATGCEEEGAVGDLLCNLMHFCDRAGVDFLSEMGRAVQHYEQETSNDAAGQSAGVLESLVSDARELMDMKVEINKDYSEEDLQRWGDRLAVAGKAVDLLKDSPLYPHLEQRARMLVASEAEQK